MVDRYADLPREMRAFLETVPPHEVAELASAIRFYGRLTDPAKKFLLNADEKTFEVLQDLREEEATRWQATTRLVAASGTVFKFILYVMATFVGAAVVMAQFGDWIMKMVNIMRGGK